MSAFHDIPYEEPELLRFLWLQRRLGSRSGLEQA